MAKADRVALIQEIEKVRGSKVITYITSTRLGLEVPMALDCVRKCYDHLKLLCAGEKEKGLIDLFIVSNGGDGIVPWRLVTLIREFAKQFNVLIPYRAFSAATLTALGADGIVMHPMGMLGPTDATVTNQFNPTNPNTKQPLGISVEDVTAYIALIKEDAGITHEDELVVAFNKLADHVHPLALGNVKRSLSQSRMMAQKLLSLHMNKSKELHQIDEIVDSLTSKLYYHGHPINRKEAVEIGLKVVEKTPQDVEDLMWKLYLEYESELKAEEQFNIQNEFSSRYYAAQTAHSAAAAAAAAAGAAAPPPPSPNMSINLASNLAFIESAKKSDCASVTHEITGTKLPTGAFQLQVNVVESGWKTA
jgi:hypothetical protein